jgi:hypothetical protein
VSKIFKDVEISFLALKRQFREKEISRREFIDRLKKLRLRDEQGRFWMIGAQSGKWYFFDGKQWVQSEPPSEPAEKVKCFTCGLENDPESEFCERCGESLQEKEAVCPRCGAKVASPFQKCPACGAGTKASSYVEDVLPRGAENFTVRRLNPAAFFIFSGGTGLILGVFLGAFAGASGLFSGMAQALPEFLATLKGTLMGGIIFAGLGGVLGFFLVGAIGYLEAHFFNSISAVMGGLKISLDRTGGKSSGGSGKGESA